MTSTTNRQGRRPRIDWSLRPRGVVSATAQGALGLAAAAAIGDMAAVHPLWGAAAGITAGIGVVLRSAYRGLSGTPLLYRLATTVGAGGWLTWAWATTPWSQASMGALGIGALTAGLLAPLARPRPYPRTPGRALVLSRTGRVAEEWEARIFRCCRLRVQVTHVQEWPTGTGYDLHVELPGGGATRAQIAAAADGLAADARLPQGCGVEVSPGQHRGEVILRVATVSRLYEAIPYPADYRSRSILDPVPIGEYRDGSTAAVLLRESSALITGQRGSGKTTLLHALTAGVGLCRDALVWHIDLNGGGLAQPWVHPWLEGRTDRPAVDWAAGTPEDALDLAAAALRIAKARKRYTRQLKIETNASLMPVSPELPEIVVIVDEGAEALSPMTRDPVLRKLRETIEEIQRIGRNEAINIVVSSLRATQDMISPSVRKQAAVRIGMYVQDDEELAYLYGWNRGLSTADLPTKGCGFVQDGQAPPRPFKGYAVQPADIVEAALAIARIRPELDEAAAEVAGEAYATRYERMRAALGEAGGGILDEDEEVISAPAQAPVPRPRLTLVKGGAQGGGLADAAAWPDLGEVAAAARTPRLVDASAWPDLGEVIAAGPARVDQAPAAAALDAPTEQIPDILARALEVFEAAGDDRMHSETLATALGTTPVELAAALREYGVAPLDHPFKRGGVRARGYALESIRQAIEAHTRGSHSGVTADQGRL